MLPQAIGKSELNFNLCPALCSNVEKTIIKNLTIGKSYSKIAKSNIFNKNQ